MALSVVVAVALTACGTPVSNLSSVNSTRVGSSDAPNSNSTSAASDAPIQLVSFQAATSSGIDVQVPKGWTQAPVRGGDYAGWKFTNPDIPDEQELVVTSSCVGCYLGANGVSSPTKVIPQDIDHVQTTVQTANKVTYTFLQAANPYDGKGTLVTSTDKSGYAYVETMFPPSQETASTEILSSFQLNR